MRAAIIGGTGFYGIPGGRFREEVLATPFGPALVFIGEGEHEDLVFLARHGPAHGVPPHRINYRANLRALKDLGVQRVVATFAVGSLRPEYPPLSLALVDQFLDFTHGREWTFFNGGKEGFAHSDMSEPTCPDLRAALAAEAEAHRLPVQPSAVYVCTNGPRLETAAEVRMYARLGGDVVGMTGVPEMPLAREAGLHYAGLAYSINWGAGLGGGQIIEFAGREVADLKTAMLAVMTAALRRPFEPHCRCESSLFEMHSPEKET